MKWTQAELKREFDHLVETRLGVLCGTADPTPEQQKIADDEAAATARNWNLASMYERSGS